jgi:hypothetical protein
MKRRFAILLALVMMLSAIPAFAGNGAPTGQHYNLNIIGVPKGMNDNFDGGNGARIFVSRTGQTQFYVHGGDSYQVLDRDGTDGKVGSGLADPGIVFPYDSATGAWKVQIWVRLVGPKTSKCNWTSYYFDGVEYVLYGTFALDKSSKFTCRTGDLLADGYQDMLWQLDPVTKLRNCQMRIYLVP